MGLTQHAARTNDTASRSRTGLNGKAWKPLGDREPVPFRSKHASRSEKRRRNNGQPGMRIRSKHMRRWSLVIGGQTKPMLTRPDSKGQRHPVESRATAPRPWTVRAENRARNRRSKVGRRNAR